METIKKQIDDALAAQANNYTIQMSLDDLIQLQADVAEIKRLLFAATDAKFIETASRVVSLENKLQTYTTY